MKRRVWSSYTALTQAELDRIEHGGSIYTVLARKLKLGGYWYEMDALMAVVRIRKEVRA